MGNFTPGEVALGRPIPYGDTEGQLGTTQGDTFWAAAKTILEQTFQVLRPGGHAIWVTKRYVRDGKIVDFSADWVRLCESVGFELLHWHKAMLVEHHGEQHDLFSEPKKISTERKSFFRRLAEKKNSPRIDWEDVLCMRKQEERSNP